MARSSAHLGPRSPLYRPCGRCSLQRQSSFKREIPKLLAAAWCPRCVLPRAVPAAQGASLSRKRMSSLYSRLITDVPLVKASHVVLWSECLCFPQIPMSKSSPSKKVVTRGGAFGRRVGREGAEQLVRVQSLQRPYKRHPEGLPSPLRHHGSTPRRCRCDPERGFSPDPDHAGTSILDFQPPKL
ncbi:uncharacterized protein LOC120600297 isoform X3 [Pteropus medius]|uniref:uncharacterized protein LOC120600297 isoform X3 n=1 Tax=Pteropus vampyrus TaxID=132908 RepID=UPI00196B6BA7|nr:uncharacterized protein LOC120600297 isoform X3 [Pteropus giganteus]